MTETNKTVLIAFVASLLTSVASIAGITTISNMDTVQGLFEDLTNTYVCDADWSNYHEFLGGISGTRLTGYPHADTHADYIRCYAPDGSKSKYYLVEEYISINGVTLEEIKNYIAPEEEPVVEPDPEPIVILNPSSEDCLKKPGTECCSPGGCVKY